MFSTVIGCYFLLPSAPTAEMSNDQNLVIRRNQPANAAPVLWEKKLRKSAPSECTCGSTMFGKEDEVGVLRLRPLEVFCYSCYSQKSERQSTDFSRRRWMNKQWLCSPRNGSTMAVRRMAHFPLRHMPLLLCQISRGEQKQRRHRNTGVVLTRL